MHRRDSDDLRLARERVSATGPLVLLFVLFGIVWVLATTWIGSQLFRSSDRIWIGLELAKGITFVLVSALLIHFVILRHARRVLQSEVDSLEKLEDRERRIEMLVDGVRDHMIGLLSRDGAILTWNRGAEALTGFESEEVCGRSISQLLAEGTIIEGGPAAYLERAARSNFERVRWQRRDGSELVTEGRVFAVADDGGVTRYFAMIFQDVSERLAFEQERELLEEERERMRGQLEQLTRIESLGKLAGTMAHEFNNVLMGIKPFTEVIEKLAHEERILQANRYIATAVQRGKRTTEEILRFARPTEPRRTLVPVERLLHDIALLSRGILDPIHELTIRPIDEEILLEVDREQMQQVFTNLLINARDAMPDRGRITITAERHSADHVFPFGSVPSPDHLLHLQLSDTGTGFSEQIRKFLFEPMFTTKRTGTGLGLAIVRQIITAHDGHVFAESIEGHGSTFHLFLPIWSSQSSPSTT